MPENGPSSANTVVNYYFFGFINLVDVQIKIVIDDITRSCYQNRGNNQEDELSGVVGMIDR